MRVDNVGSMLRPPALLAACGGAPATTPGGGATPEAGGAAGAPQPGGSMTVAYQNDIATLDPAIGYDWNNWPMEKMVFDALMDYADLAKWGKHGLSREEARERGALAPS